jgi:hypothetical protein
MAIIEIKCPVIRLVVACMAVDEKFIRNFILKAEILFEELQESENLETGIDGRVILKLILKQLCVCVCVCVCVRERERERETERGCGRGSTDLAQIPRAGFYKHGNNLGIL